MTAEREVGDNYLRSLVRMDIRKKERGLAKLAPKPGQSAEESEAFRTQLEEALAFRRDMLARLNRKEEEMEITYEVELAYGDEGPDDGEPSPTADDVATAVRDGLKKLGFSGIDVRVT